MISASTEMGIVKIDLIKTMSLEEKYQEYTNRQLIEVVLKAKDYQPAAVEIAKSILKQRDISSSEREDAKKAIEIEKISQEKREQSKLESEEKAVNFIKKLLNKINPLNKTEPTANSIINLVTLVFGLLFLQQLYYSFDYLIFLLENLNFFHYDTLLVIFEIILLPLSIYLFFKRKKIGWILLTAIMSYYVVSYIALIIYNLNAPVIDSPILNLINYQPNYTRLFLIVAFYLGSLIALLRRDIKIVFSISNLTMYLSILFGALGVIILMASMDFINILAN